MTTARLAIDGGTPLRPTPLQAWPSVFPEAVAAASAILKSGRIKMHRGGAIEAFEQELAALCEARAASTACNGTLSLELALRALGVQPGESILLSAYDHPASLDAVRAVGARPVFADVCADAPNIHPDALAQLPAHSPLRAIMVTHMYGLADVDAWEAYAADSGIPIIYDCARVLGARWQSRSVGSFGACCSFSFEESKHIQAGEGGALTTCSESLAAQIIACRNRGKNREGSLAEPAVLGSNYRYTEVHAAYLRPQLEALDQTLEHRRRGFQFLSAALASFAIFTPLPIDARVTLAAPYSLMLRYSPRDSSQLGRDRLVAALQAEGIPCNAGWMTPLESLARTTGNSVSWEGFPHARQFREQTIVFPGSILHAPLGELADVPRALEKILETL